MIKIYMPLSGNVGDTLNVMPVLSGIYKSSGHVISLVINDRMQLFKGLRELLLMQDCICKVQFKSDVIVDDTYNILSLVDNFQPHPIRPWETVRLEEYFRRNYDLNFEVDDNFILKVPEVDFKPDTFYIGDRMYHSSMDMRRKFNTLADSGKFDLSRVTLLDYEMPMYVNAGILAQTNKPFFTTFTGTSVIADLLNKEQIVLWGEDLKNWDNKDIEYSFNKHHYRDRKSKLVCFSDFHFNEYS